MQSIQTASGAHPNTYSMVNAALSPGAEQPRCEVDQSPLSSAIVKDNLMFF